MVYITAVTVTEFWMRWCLKHLKTASHAHAVRVYMLTNLPATGVTNATTHVLYLRHTQPSE